MKTQLLVLVLSLSSFFGNKAWSQPAADNMVTQGRIFLTQRNITNANDYFASAVAISTNHQNANALQAITRILAVVYQAPAQNFLTRLGVSSPGRDIYQWTAGFPVGDKLQTMGSAGTSGAEFAPFWRTNILKEITNALGNLSRITNSSFLINLASNETTLAAVDVDYGDILMLQAGLHFMEYWSYTLILQNLDAQLSALRSLFADGRFDVQQMLMDYPQLLTFTSTNDLAKARTAFANFSDRYQQASDFLRQRPPGTTRLFNFVDNNSTGEPRFRQTVVDLKASLNSAIVLTDFTNFTFFAGSQFSGQHSFRSFLPRFAGPNMALGTLPDPTFGGVLVGRSRDEVEGFILEETDFGKHIPTVAAMDDLQRPVGAQPFRFTIRAKPGKGYVVQSSTNLTQWQDAGAFVAVDRAVDFTEGANNSTGRVFYRIVDRGSVPPPTNDYFTNRVTLTGSPVQALGYNVGASFFTESGEPGLSNGRSVWYSWTAPASGTFTVKVATSGFNFAAGVYTGSAVNSLSTVVTTYGWDAQFTATAGQIYHIKVESGFSFFGGPATGGFKLSINQI
ncbi:MAG: hypothetical protein HZA89_01920 [Verrucomicrobia bacterium]|nr:hypothetical protein [Verrucomicrobiota bacterium]